MAGYVYVPGVGTVWVDNQGYINGGVNNINDPYYKAQLDKLKPASPSTGAVRETGTTQTTQTSTKFVPGQEIAKAQRGEGILNQKTFSFIPPDENNQFEFETSEGVSPLTLQVARHLSQRRIYVIAFNANGTTLTGQIALDFYLNNDVVGSLTGGSQPTQRIGTTNNYVGWQPYNYFGFNVNAAPFEAIQVATNFGGASNYFIIYPIKCFLRIDKVVMRTTPEASASMLGVMSTLGADVSYV